MDSLADDNVCLIYRRNNVSSVAIRMAQGSSITPMRIVSLRAIVTIRRRRKYFILSHYRVNELSLRSSAMCPSNSMMNKEICLTDYLVEYHLYMFYLTA